MYNNENIYASSLTIIAILRGCVRLFCNLAYFFNWTEIFWILKKQLFNIFQVFFLQFLIKI